VVEEVLNENPTE